MDTSYYENAIAQCQVEIRRLHGVCRELEDELSEFRTALAVPLTAKEWQEIAWILSDAVKFGKNEQEAWEDLSHERNEDGTPKYQYAAGNAKVWEKKNAQLEAIRQKLDAALAAPPPIPQKKAGIQP